MRYKEYKNKYFTLHTIKTDKFKTCHMEILFRKEAKKEDFASLSMLTDILTDTSSIYPTRKAVVIKQEELYKTVFYGVTNKVGNVVCNNYILDFIAPKFIAEKDYLEEVIKFPLEMLQNPNVINDEFNQEYFNIVKNRLIKEVESVKEDVYRLSIINSLKEMDDKSISSFRVQGTVEEIEKITAQSLYKDYIKFGKEMTCDIYVIGNLDMDELFELIKKYYRINSKKHKKYNYVVNNKQRSKIHKKIDISKYNQSQLNMVFNLDSLSLYERDTVFLLFNHIYASGGLTSKLYKSIREKESLCYGVEDIYLRFDNLLLIHVSLDKVNVKRCITLIKKGLKEMCEGKFDESDLIDAKTNVNSSVDMFYDNPIAIISNYIFSTEAGTPKLEERKERYNKVSKEDIVKVANKLKLNTIYIMEGSGESEGN